VVDLGRYMVHCFTSKGREEMDLDSLYTDMKDNV
jgi:ribosomal silencing factor RsfS